MFVIREVETLCKIEIDGFISVRDHFKIAHAHLDSNLYKHTRTKIVINSLGGDEITRIANKHLFERTEDLVYHGRMDVNVGLRP